MLLYCNNFSAIKEICSFVVPQQPPTIEAPCSKSFSIPSANSFGCISYSVIPLISFGKPAFGFAINGIEVYSFIPAMISHIFSGPVEQLTPTASTPSFSKTIAAVNGSVPYKVLLSS